MQDTQHPHTPPGRPSYRSGQAMYDTWSGKARRCKVYIEDDAKGNAIHDLLLKYSGCCHSMYLFLDLYFIPDNTSCLTDNICQFPAASFAAAKPGQTGLYPVSRCAFPYLPKGVPPAGSSGSLLQYLQILLLSSPLDRTALPVPFTLMKSCFPGNIRHLKMRIIPVSLL